MEYIISTDSGCDISLNMCKEYDIRPLFMHYTEGENVYTDKMDNSETVKFYKEMEEGKVFKTTQVNYQEAYDYFTELIKEGKPIIHVTLGSAISGTYNNCAQAAKQVEEDKPGSKIVVIDSTCASLGYGMMVLEASKMRSEGKSMDEVIAYIESVKRGVNPYFTTSTLTYLARGGRVTKIASIFGNVLSIRPILRLDYAGALLVYQKGHGHKNTMAKMIECIKEAVINPEDQILYLSHSNAINDAVEFAEKAKAEIGFKDVVYTYIGTIIGAHTGPGLIAAFFHGKDRFE